MKTLLAILVLVDLAKFCRCQGSSTTASSSTTKDPRIGVTTGDDFLGFRKPTESDLIALIGGCSIFILCLIVVIGWVIYKKRGDRIVKRLEKENDLEEAKLDEEDRAARVKPEIIDPKVQEQERRELAVKHEKDLKNIKTPNQSLLNQVDNGAKRTLDQIKREAAPLLRGSSKGKTVPDVIKSSSDALSKADAAMSESALSTMAQSRCPEIKVRRDTRVIAKMPVVWFDEKGAKKDFPLNMNRFTDAAGHSVFIGQALGKDQPEELMWRIIWDNEIAVLIWIGSRALKEKTYFKPYAPITERAEVFDCGLFIVTLNNKFQLSGHKVLYYELEVKHAVTFEKREIRLFFLDDWPKWNMANAETSMIDILAKAHERLYKSKPTMVCETMLHNLLIQCPTGIHQSVTFAVMHLCRQTWLGQGKINVLAVATYIRKHRYKAWNLSQQELLDEVKLIYAFLEKFVDIQTQAKASCRLSSSGKGKAKQIPARKSFGKGKSPLKLPSKSG